MIESEEIRIVKVVLFGTGNYARNIYSKIEKNLSGLDIVGFCDNNSDNWGECFGRRVYAPHELGKEIDKIIILSNLNFEEIKDGLIYWHKIPEDKIENIYFLLKCLMSEKYQTSEDLDILETLEYWKNNQLTVFNQFVKEEMFHVVEWDYIENMPFIILEDKKMYYPYDTKFESFEGKKIIRNVMQEQQETSPHLYIKDDITINEGDIIADVGAAEGDFSIRLVEKASKIYLFEGDKKWWKPLRKTFEKFKDKIEFINKYAGYIDDNNLVRMDTIIKEKIDFLKMDVEGSECEALLGARKLLINGNVKCAICSYHRAGDEIALKDILNAYGYRTNTSMGYMLYYHDANIFSTLDFRRGIVYGRKEKGLTLRRGYNETN